MEILSWKTSITKLWGCWFNPETEVYNALTEFHFCLNFCSIDILPHQHKTLPFFLSWYTHPRPTQPHHTHIHTHTTYTIITIDMEISYRHYFGELPLLYFYLYRILSGSQLSGSQLWRCFFSESLSPRNRFYVIFKRIRQILSWLGNIYSIFLEISKNQKKHISIKYSHKKVLI